MTKVMQFPQHVLIRSPITSLSYDAKACLPADMVQFYAAELVMCIATVHRMGYAHRDIKPDNVLIGADGKSLCPMCSVSELI